MVLEKNLLHIRVQKYYYKIHTKSYEGTSIFIDAGKAVDRVGAYARIEFVPVKLVIAFSINCPRTNVANDHLHVESY